MGEFVEKSVSKTATRDPASSIADITAISVLVLQVIENNPFECSVYQVGSVSHYPVEKTRETCTAQIAYSDVDAKTVGQVVARAETSAGYTASITSHHWIGRDLDCDGRHPVP